MRSLFLVVLFTFTTILVESPLCRADGDFYTELRKKKNPSAAEVNEIRKRTADESRRSSVNQISAATRADSAEAEKAPIDPKAPTTKNDIEDVPDPAAAKANVSPKSNPSSSAPPAPSTASKSSVGGGHRPHPSQTINSEGSPAVKVDAGDIDELEFPGAEAKPKVAPKKKTP